MKKLIESLKENRTKIFGNFVAGLGGVVLVAAAGSALGKETNELTVAALVYGATLQPLLAAKLAKKM